MSGGMNLERETDGGMSGGMKDLELLLGTQDLI